MEHGKGERNLKNNSIPAFAGSMRIYPTCNSSSRIPSRSDALHLTQSVRTGSVRASPFLRIPSEVNIIIHEIVPYYKERILPACPVAFLSCRTTDDGHVRRIIRCGNKKSYPRGCAGGERRRGGDVQTPRSKDVTTVNQIIYTVARSKSRAT